MNDTTVRNIGLMFVLAGIVLLYLFVLDHEPADVHFVMSDGNAFVEGEIIRLDLEREGVVAVVRSQRDVTVYFANSVNLTRGDFVVVFGEAWNGKLEASRFELR